MFELFWLFFRIGLFSIGGGYAMIPLIQQDMVGAGYMTASQVTDMVAISQMTPGPIAVNAATFAGMNAMGVGGAVIATIGAVLPCALISVILARFFCRSMDSALVQSVLYGMRPVVVSLIAGVMITFAASSLFLPGGGMELGAAAIFAGIFTLALVRETSPAVLFLISALAGLLLYAP